MSATTAAAAAAVSVMIASTCRLIAIAIVAVARAALVMMVMVALLLALQAHVRDDHLRVVAHAVVIAAASIKEQNLHQSVLLYLPLPVSLSVSPVQILTGALHVVAQIVAGARHAGRIQRLLAAQSVVRAVLRGGFMQILPCLAVVSVKCKATSFCQSHNSPWLSRDTNLLSPLREPEVELSKLATVLQSGEARWR